MPNALNLCRAILILVGLALSAASTATPITANAGWYGFCFAGIGTGAEPGCQNLGVGEAGNPFTVSLLEAGLVKVTDAFDVGDIFDVYIDSLFSFTTSAPGVGPATDDPDIAYNSGYFSAGSAFLSAGSHTIEIFVNASPFQAGGAYIEVETRATPIPATLLLIGTGLLGLGWSRRVPS